MSVRIATAVLCVWLLASPASAQPGNSPGQPGNSPGPQAKPFGNKCSDWVNVERDLRRVFWEGNGLKVGPNQEAMIAGWATIFKQGYAAGFQTGQFARPQAQFQLDTPALQAWLDGVREWRITTAFAKAVDIRCADPANAQVDS